MIKIAMIGAGSVGFSRNLTGDILAYPEFKNATLSYMDIDAERLEVGAALCHKVAAAQAATPRIETTLDLREALSGADFVINMMQIGGFDATLMDFEIPRKYGLNFTIADTTGPGGLFRALRTFGPIRNLCETMEKVCPHAWLLNYSNPMSMNMQTIARTSNVRAVGLCHSVQGTIGPLERYLGEDAGSVNFVVAGINHMAFFLKLEKNGEDLYPRLFERMNEPKIYNSNKVRFELMKRLGYFVTESSEHNAEYNPYFIPHGAATIEEFGVPLDEYLRRSDSTVDEFARLKKIARSDEPVRIEKIDGNTLTINQPLRIDFPIVDGSYIQKILPIRRCGVEDLSLEQTTDNWTSGIIFSNAWDCFARRVHVVKAGRWPVYFVPAKNCEIRDSRFDDAWWKGGGGTAYVGWEFAYDCLMDGVRTTKLRHAPLVQWSAAGNVIRNGVFEDSDGQWHSGWTQENLFENCTIDSKQGNGSYGYGLWASPPEDEAHGPNGPRNVVYNCDIKSEKAGLWLGGMNEGWIIAHNRFDVAAGVGIFAKDASFDHTIWDNTFILRDKTSPALQLAREDCVGIEFWGNRISGGGKEISTGVVAPLVERDNVREPLQEMARPQPKVASIFDWQRRQK